jgi:hypothetical protein
MRNVFIDNELETRFQKDGYVELPFLVPREVEELKALFFSTLQESGGQITSGDLGGNSEHEITYDFTFIDRNHEYKRHVFELITERFLPKMNGILDNYTPIIANFIRKKSHEGEVPLHQNWAFADEMKCSTVSIWCPLVDSSKANGTLEVVPGSHKRVGQYRGPMIPWELEGIKQEIIDHYLTPLETKAGDCVILDDSIVHYSAVNTTNDLRLAIQLICIPKEEKAKHYHLDHSIPNNKTIDVLEVDQEFFIQFNPWKFPDNAKKIGSVPLQFKPMSSAGFNAALASPRFDELDVHSNKTGFVSRLNRFFKRRSN